MYYGHWTLIERRFTTITEGQIYQSGHLTPDRLLDKVEEYGIKTVINLATGEDLGADALAVEERVLQEAGVRYVHLPVQDVKADTARAFLEIAADPRNRPLLVHCEHGEGRSVVLAAIYRIEVEGWENDRARRAARLIPFAGSFRPDGRNGKFLIEYVPQTR